MRDQFDLNAELKQQQMIQPLSRRRVQFPLRGLRVWLFSLLAIISLPVGMMLMLVGFEMQDSSDANWEEMTATVRSNDDVSIFYDYGDDSGQIIYELDAFTSQPIVGELVVTGSLCDLVGWVIIPSERGETFPLWVNPTKPSQHSCVPISQDMGAVYLMGGVVLVGLSVLRLLRTIASAAANKPQR